MTFNRFLHHRCACYVPGTAAVVVLLQSHLTPQTLCAFLQDFVFQELAQHYVSQVLTGQTGIDNASLLWTQAIADAACRLLR